jgi:cobalt-zinc-cadmium efflux system protein
MSSTDNKSHSHSHSKSHNHSHGHSNGHAHSHSHTKDMSSNRIGWAFFLNLGFTIIEFIGGWLTNSTAIMSDAVHDLGDTLSIGSAWVLNKLGKKQANNEFSYGFRRLSLFGALLNGFVLIIGSIWVMTEAIPRLFNPVMPEAEGMILLAIFGVCVNGFAAYKLSGGESLNERILNWHLLEDVLGWVAVLIVSIVLMFVELPILDPLLSIAFTLFILVNVARNLWTTLKLFAQSSPDAGLTNKVKQTLLKLNFVADLHHFHLWSLDGESHVLTVHLSLKEYLDITQQEALKLDIKQHLAEFKLEHTTIEFEWPDEVCRDA